MKGRQPLQATALALLLALVAVLLLAAGLAAGGEGWSLHWRQDAALIADIRAPRTLGAFCAGALLALAGAIAQGLFRNPLADPYLLGSAAGAGLAVVLLLALAGLVAGAEASAMAEATAGLASRLGLFGAAFVGALGGVVLTLLLAGGGARPTLMLLCGVVVAVLLTAATDLAILFWPELLRSRQVFSLGTTAFVGWTACALLAATLFAVLMPALKLAGVLDALVLGEATAASLGLALPRLRLALVALMALATGCAVAQVGLVAFVGLVAPHLVRRAVVVRHAPLLLLSALAGGVLLLAADVTARVLLAPRELPVGVLTAIFGGIYLLALLRRRGERR
jgi:iron complex transport system permease protein